MEAQSKLSTMMYHKIDKKVSDLRSNCLQKFLENNIFIGKL